MNLHATVFIKMDCDPIYRMVLRPALFFSDKTFERMKEDEVSQI